MNLAGSVSCVQAQGSDSIPGTSCKEASGEDKQNHDCVSGDTPSSSFHSFTSHSHAVVLTQGYVPPQPQLLKD